MLTKTGKLLAASTSDLPADYSGAYALAGGLGGASGASLLASSINSGDLTGRHTLYSVVNADDARNAFKHGLFPDKHGAVYVNKNLGDAGLLYKYREILHRRAGRPGKGQSVVKINLPTWKFKHGPVLPEGVTAEEVSKRLRGRGVGKLESLLLSGAAEKARKIEGHIGREYVPGAWGYQRNSLKEILQYAKARPRDFLRGVGRAGAGAGLLGLGALAAHQAWKHRGAE